VSGVHLLAAYCQTVEAVVAQLRVPGKTNEHKTALELLKLVPLDGALITGDAAFTQRDLCAEVVEGGATISSPRRRISPPSRPTSGPRSPGLFPPREQRRRQVEDDQATRHAKGHGRVEVRRIRATTRLNDYLDWPGLAQVCLIERTRRSRGQETTETVAAIKSLKPEEAGAADLLGIAPITGISRIAALGSRYELRRGRMPDPHRGGALGPGGAAQCRLEPAPRLGRRKHRRSLAAPRGKTARGHSDGPTRGCTRPLKDPGCSGEERLHSKRTRSTHGTSGRIVGPMAAAPRCRQPARPRVFIGSTSSSTVV
jgi:hypothetical protein